LFSSVLQYVEFPYHILKEAIDSHIEYIIIDRTGFTLNDKDRITIQKVPSCIYEATYPCWFFSETNFLAFFEDNGYELVADFDALDKVNIPSRYKGFIFKRKDAYLQHTV
jgi:putative methyltransferase (TIGR04325 family)